MILIQLSLSAVILPCAVLLVQILNIMRKTAHFVKKNNIQQNF